MTLPAIGPISLGNVRAEIGIGGAIGLGDSAVRTLTGLTSGPVSLNDCHGKTGAGGGGGGGTLTGTGHGDDSFGLAGIAFTANAFPTVTAAGGSGAGYTYLWSIAIQDDTGFTLTNAATSAPTVSHHIGKYGYVGGCTLRCILGDSAGGSFTVEGIQVTFDYESTL